MVDNNQEEEEESAAMGGDNANANGGAGRGGEIDGDVMMDSVCKDDLQQRDNE